MTPPDDKNAALADELETALSYYRDGTEEIAYFCIRNSDAILAALRSAPSERANATRAEIVEQCARVAESEVEGHDPENCKRDCDRAHIEGKIEAAMAIAKSIRALASSAAPGDGEWRPIESAPKDGDGFILLYCPEGNSRWLANWQRGRWFGVDDYGLTREGHSAGDADVVTGWAVTHWRPLPAPPHIDSNAAEKDDPK
jgi:hypothetical protein